MKMCHRGWWQNHTSTHYTSYAQCEHLTPTYLVRAHIWRRGGSVAKRDKQLGEFCAYKSARVCVYTIRKTQFLGSHQFKKASERKFVVCDTKYNLPKHLQHLHVLRDNVVEAAFCFYYCCCFSLILSYHGNVNEYVLSYFYLAPFYPLIYLSPALMIELLKLCVCAHLFLHLLFCHIFEEVTLKWGKSMLWNP